MLRRAATLLSALAIIAAMVPAAASAVVYTVDTTADGADDGECVTDCTLREAMALAVPGNAIDMVEFGVAGTITLTTALPAFTNATQNVTIDGSSAPGASPGNPTVEIDGNGLTANGLTIDGGSNLITTVAIINFDGAGIRAAPFSSSNGVSGCYIGLELDGVTPAPNNTGIFVDNAFNFGIGGSVAGQGNVISGNDDAAGAGVRVDNSINGINIEGNRIGTNAAGTAAVPNAGAGVLVGPGLVGGSIDVGGSNPGETNVISGNGGAGVEISSVSASSTTVSGNLIGTNAAGTAALANGGAGVEVGGTVDGVAIGGASAEGNVISGNTGDGILLGTGTTNTFVNHNNIGLNLAQNVALPNGGSGVHTLTGSTSTIGTFSDGNDINANSGDGIEMEGDGLIGPRNIITANGVGVGDLGIDLGADGVTANDAAPDADTGPNDLLNFPDLTAVDITPTQTTFTGTLAAEANEAYFVSFFFQSFCDDSGFGEGRIFHYGETLFTDAGGNVSFNITVPATIPVGFDEITASTVHAVPPNETSEFSQCQTASRSADPPPPPPPGPGPGPATPSAPVPSNGDTVVTAPVSGTVKVKRPGGGFSKLGAGEAIPVGSIVDATKGRVKLTSVSDKGVVQSAEFYAGKFKIAQKDGDALVELVLQGGDFKRCNQPKGGGQKGGAKRGLPLPTTIVRRLWGSGKGKFKTKGKGGSASVRGTVWLTADRCDGTFFKVKEGAVQVEDFGKKKSLKLTAGKTYLAKKV